MRLVYVSGMHRSGTSATTRVLNLLGLSLGPPAALLPTAPDNPTGFWEARDVAHLNNRLLNSLGGTWQEPPVLASGWAFRPEVDAFLVDATSCLESIAREPSDLYVVKDPRFSLTLPLWARARDPHEVVIPVRHPLHVAQSLERRNHLPLDQGLGLWIRYVREAFRSSPSAVVVHYEDLMDEPEALAFHLTAALGIAPPLPTTLATVKQFVDRGLDHGHEPADGRSSHELDMAMDMFTLLLRSNHPRVEPAVVTALSDLDVLGRSPE